MTVLDDAANLIIRLALTLDDKRYGDDGQALIGTRNQPTDGANGNRLKK